MSYTPGFYNNAGSNFTFQNNMQSIHPQFTLPCPPPPPVTPFSLTPKLTDQEYVKKFDNRSSNKKSKRILNNASISDVHDKLQTLLLSWYDLKIQEGKLQANVDTLSENEWKCALDDIENNKNVIDKIVSKLGSSYLDLSRRLITKRAAKRLRIKRLRKERKKEKTERIKLLEERSRKIDESLQKIQDDIQKAKKEEEAKLQADMVLKDLLRKKHDAKKSIGKLDALLKLRRARQNTAKGRGQQVSDTEASVFQNNIDRIKKLWEHKLLSYEKEESESRAKLQSSTEEKHLTKTKEQQVSENLVKWREVLFGSNQYPQVDFKGRVQEFIAIRSQWDSYIADELNSTPLPVGWVIPPNRGMGDEPPEGWVIPSEGTHA